MRRAALLADAAVNASEKPLHDKSNGDTMMRYAIWNNKGGVGKSFLTFVFATEYALANPKKVVYVIDMCPQANVSEILLGGNGNGARRLRRLMSGERRRTIGGYFDSRLEQPYRITGNEADFSIRVNSRNDKIPSNLFLVAGDPSLEVQAEAINQIANLSLPADTWEKVHSWLDDLCDALERKTPNSTFFIDCNPSFAAYTELSIVAANKLIIPCSADGSSARAIGNIGQLVYGQGVPDKYKGAMFSSRLKNEGIAPPSICLILLNRSTQYNKKASQAFRAMFDEIKERAGKLLNSESAARGGQEGNYFHEIPDTHSVAIVASHLGIPIRKIEVRRYEVLDQSPQVNEGPLIRYKDAIKSIVELL